MARPRLPPLQIATTLDRDAVVFDGDRELRQQLRSSQALKQFWREIQAAGPPPDRRVERWILALRVHDALLAGASQREIARVLFGDASGQGGGDRRADSIRSRVRRLSADARRLAGGGYRALMRRRD